MKKLFLGLILIGMMSYCHGQLFYFSVPNTHFLAEPGAGFDSRLYIGLSHSSHSKAFISAQPTAGVKVIFQPDTLSVSDTIVMSVTVTDSNLIGQTLPVDIKAEDSTGEIVRTIYVQVVNYCGSFPEYPAITYRDQAINYLKHEHPDIVTKYGDMLNYDWLGFWQYPPLLVVSNYVFLTNNWRCNVLWHIMIPPYDWKHIFIYNDVENECWGVNIDTDGNFTEIPCEKHYYFFQDSIPLSIHNSESESKAVYNYPNPCTNYTTIEFPNPDKTYHTVRIYNSCGQLVQEIFNIRENKVKLENLHWQSGVYYYNIENEKGTVVYGRITKLDD